MTTTEEMEEIINNLKAQNAELTELLDQTLAEPKSIVKIVAGPFEEKDQQYYRATKGSDALVVFLSKEPLFGVDPITDPIEPDTEVIVVGQTIMAIIPEELKVKIENPTFNLVDWDGIGGLKSQVADIRRAIEMPLNNAKLAEELGVQPIAGILLYGPPGTGKTLIAKAIANAVLGATVIDASAFKYLKGGEMLSKYVGEAENNIKKAFADCREYTRKTGKKAVMFIDEAEALLPTRGSRKSSDVETTIVPTFLSEMSGLEGDNPIVVLATNHKNAIDAAVIREGRIDIKIEIKRPTQSDALEIFEIHLKKVKLHDSITDLCEFASEALFTSPAKEKVSGAMIEAIAKDSIRITMDRLMSDPKCKERGVTMMDVAESIKSISLSYAK